MSRPTLWPGQCLEPEAIAMLSARRGRAASVRLRAEAADRERRNRFWLALVAALLLHALLYVGLRRWTLLQNELVRETSVIELRLIDPMENPPIPDVADHRSTVAQAQAAVAARPIERRLGQPQPVAQATSSASLLPRSPAAAAETSPQLFGQDGRVRLPEVAKVDDPAVFASRKPIAEFTPDPMAHNSPLPYKPTPFDRYWKPDGETLLGEWVRKASRKSVYDTKHGTRITCEAFLFFAACGWGPTPRVSIEELRAMRVNPPLPRHSADEPYLPAQP